MTCGSVLMGERHGHLPMTNAASMIVRLEQEGGGGVGPMTRCREKMYGHLHTTVCNVCSEQRECICISSMGGGVGVCVAMLLP